MGHTVDKQGKGSFQGESGKAYKIHVHDQVTSAQIDALFKSYDGLAADLEGFLRKEWAGFKPQWSNQSASAKAMAIGTGILEGGWETIKGVWDGISKALDILQNPKNSQRMCAYISTLEPPKFETLMSPELSRAATDKNHTKKESCTIVSRPHEKNENSPTLRRTVTIRLGLCSKLNSPSFYLTTSSGALT